MRENTMYENMIAVTNRQLYLQAAEKNRCRDGKEDEEVSEAFLPGTRLWNRYLEQTEQVLSLFPKSRVLSRPVVSPLQLLPYYSYVLAPRYDLLLSGKRGACF